MDEHERIFERNAKRRVAAEDRYLDKLDRLVPQAEKLVGELCREGRTIFYINVKTKDGRMTGRTKEFTNQGAAIDYLIRNHYV